MPEEVKDSPSVPPPDASAGKKRSKKSSKETNTDFNVASKGQLIVAGIVIALLLALRFSYDDGRKKGKGADLDDLLDGQDLYDILQVPKGASDKEVKKGYHKLAIKWHPDKNQGCAECHTTFQRVARAYEVLSDGMKRKIYDKEQTLMEKSITSNTESLTTANYHATVQDGDIWLIQVFVDWSDRAQYFSPIWEEAASRLKGTGVRVGRVNMGRDKGLATRLLAGGKDSLPSVTIFDGETEIRRLRWEFQDTSVEGIVRLVATAVSERYKAKVLTEHKQLQELVRRRASKVRLLFVGKAGSKEQIMVVATAGKVSRGAMVIATTSKLSVGTAAYANVKPPAVLIWRGDADAAPEVYPHARLRLAELEAWLTDRRRLLFPSIHRGNYPEVCGTEMWCALSVLADAERAKAGAGHILSTAITNVEAAVEGAKIAVGALLLSEQPQAITFAGVEAGDVVLIQRVHHGSADAGAGQARLFVVQKKDAASGETLSLLIQGALEGKAPPRRQDSEQDFLTTLAPPKSSILEGLSDVLENMPVQMQIMLYLTLGIVGLVLVCPLIKPFITAADRRFHPSDEAEPARGGEREDEGADDDDDEDEEEEEDGDDDEEGDGEMDDVVLVKKKN